jgi:hypothetical protein
MRKSLLIVATALLLASTASAKNLYVPVVGRVDGANGTFFRTDVRIFNPSATHDLGISLHFLPRGIEGSNIPGRIVTVPRRQMVVLDDIVGNFFKMSSGLGALRLDSDEAVSYSFSADSRTYTDSANGTFGQFIPALDVDDAVKDHVVLHVTQDAEYRTNVGVMNPSRDPAQITASLFRADGTLVAPEVVLSVPPLSMIQNSLPATFVTDAQLDDAFVVLKSSVPIFTWASVIDNRSGDQIFIPGAEDKDEVTPLPPLP